MMPASLVQSRLTGRERFAVTGATGWFGQCALDLLDAVLGDEAAVRVTAYASRERAVRTRTGRTVEVHPLSDLPHQHPAPTHILHFAFLTRDLVAVRGFQEYVTANLTITTTLLEAIIALEPAGLVLTSSGAVYSETSFETDLRNHPYGTLKHLDERLLGSAMGDVGGTTAIARVFNVAGAGITKPDHYALGSLIGMAIRGEPLTVRATVPVVRSYVGVDEVIGLALWATLRGPSVTFDTGGEITEIGDLARLIARVHGLPESRVLHQLSPQAPGDRYLGRGDEMARLAEDAGLVLRPLEALVRETSTWLTARAVVEPRGRA